MVLWPSEGTWTSSTRARIRAKPRPWGRSGGVGEGGVKARRLRAARVG